MAIHHTIDHESIRAWVEENGGVPALIKDEVAQNGRDMPAILFDPEHLDGKVISWEEFFDIFETSKLRFHFDTSTPKDEARWACGLSSREEALDVSDETGMPEDIEYMDENIFPSAP